MSKHLHQTLFTLDKRLDKDNDRFFVIKTTMFSKNYLEKTTKISAKCKRINEEDKKDNKDEDSIKYILSIIERGVISRRIF